MCESATAGYISKRARVCEKRETRRHMARSLRARNTWPAARALACAEQCPLCPETGAPTSAAPLAITHPLMPHLAALVAGVKNGGVKLRYMRRKKRLRLDKVR